MKMPQSVRAEELLVDDFVAIQGALKSPLLKDLQASIIGGTAPAQGIEAHYRAFDAIDQPASFKSEKAAYLHVQAMGRVALADFIGGAQILSTTLMSGALGEHGGYNGILPTLFNDDSIILAQQQYDLGNVKDRDVENWNLIAGYSIETNNHPVKNLAERVGLLHFARIAGFLDSDVAVTSTEALKAISLGKVIMGEGSRGFRHYIDLQRSAFLRTKDDLEAANTLIDVAEEPKLALDLSNLMLRSANILDTIEAKDIYLKEMKNLFGPMLSWPTAERAAMSTRFRGEYHTIDVSLLRDTQQDSFSHAIGGLQLLIDFARGTNPDMFKKGRIKGSLHEVLWMLDAYAVRKGMPESYGEYVVCTSTEAEDMPFIGKPSMKRGFDFVIQPRLNSTERRLIQVGASGQKLSNKAQQPYHPGIELYCEEPFNEVNLATLEKKISLYKKWAEGGLTEKDYARLKIHDQLLGTVKQCFGV
jgi:hypothetical protein